MNRLSFQTFDFELGWSRGVIVVDPTGILGCKKGIAIASSINEPTA